MLANYSSKYSLLLQLDFFVNPNAELRLRVGSMSGENRFILTENSNVAGVEFREGINK